MSMDGSTPPGEGNAGRRVVTLQELQTWLAANLARRLNLDPAEIDVKAPFAQYGMDSQTGAGLQGDLERWLGVELSPTLVWDYPSIEEVARHVLER
jgi:acyl carrier protein